jgi:pyruvate/2-oxoglutarate dehydrogenase complex dihydrolipoamide dehydrogenase (E3) component
MQNFDAIIIGTGQAGPPLAARLVEAGMKVATIERKFFGGTCVNTGCIPTKTLVASAYMPRPSRAVPRNLASELRATSPQVRSTLITRRRE